MIIRRVLMRRVAGALGVALVAAALLTGCVREEEAEDSVQGVEQATTPTPEFVPFATVLPPTSQPTIDPAVTPVPLTPTVVGPTPFVKPTVTPAPTATPQPGVCPEPVRKGPEDAGTPLPLSAVRGDRIEGGSTLTAGGSSLRLPPGRQFVVSIIVSGDPALFIYDVASGSTLRLRYPDGCELIRYVYDVALDTVFDEIVAGFEASSQ